MRPELATAIPLFIALGGVVTYLWAKLLPPKCPPVDREFDRPLVPFGVRTPPFCQRRQFKRYCIGSIPGPDRIVSGNHPRPSGNRHRCAGGMGLTGQDRPARTRATLLSAPPLCPCRDGSDRVLHRSFHYVRCRGIVGNLLLYPGGLLLPAESPGSFGRDESTLSRGLPVQ